MIIVFFFFVFIAVTTEPETESLKHIGTGNQMTYALFHIKQKDIDVTEQKHESKATMSKRHKVQKKQHEQGKT